MIRSHASSGGCRGKEGTPSKRNEPMRNVWKLSLALVLAGLATAAAIACDKDDEKKEPDVI